MAEPEEMYRCQTVNCGYIYDPDRGDRKGKIEKGTAFKDLPDTWRCPICGGTRKCFRPMAGPGSTDPANCELPTDCSEMVIT
ncbi:MAG: rubredoxin [Proteobacteria bacterium]|nr:rubredoxin [Pseudomonadota bacterium]